jgi:aminoglycoside 6'-N-acetyltransferase I
MNIRTIKPADAPEWVRLRTQLWPHHDHATDIAAFFSGTAREPVAVFVAELENGKLAGFAEVSVRRDYVEGAKSSPVAHLEGWFVEPAHRGRGIGKRLIACAETWVAAAGFDEFASDAAADNEAGIQAHRACGFRAVGTNVHFIKSISRPR